MTHVPLEPCHLVIVDVLADHSAELGEGAVWLMDLMPITGTAKTPNAAGTLGAVVGPRTGYMDLVVGYDS